MAQVAFPFPTWQSPLLMLSSEPIDLPDPFSFSIPTDQWPPYSEDGDSD